MIFSTRELSILHRIIRPIPYVLITINTLNKPVKQYTPDGDTSRFWYDNIGRIVISQNAQQHLDSAYSYSLYDNLSRVKEVGTIYRDKNDMKEIKARNADSLLLFSNSCINRVDVIQTWYDTPKFSILNFNQKNLRHRVASITTKKIYNNNDFKYDHATHYAYDIAGNVKSLVQDDRTLAGIKKQYKRIDYDYDLISGKVNAVYHQRDSADQYIYRYNYDDQNRLTEAFSDSVKENRDAMYTYYRHGPLKKTVLGQQQVQGLDYAYTLQGWLKAMSGGVVDTSYDIGGDGKYGTIVAADAFSHALGYYENDYESISGKRVEDVELRKKRFLLKNKTNEKLNQLLKQGAVLSLKGNTEVIYKGSVLFIDNKLAIPLFYFSFFPTVINNDDNSIRKTFVPAMAKHFYFNDDNTELRIECKYAKDFIVINSISDIKHQTMYETFKKDYLVWKDGFSLFSYDSIIHGYALEHFNNLRRNFHRND